MTGDQGRLQEVTAPRKIIPAHGTKMFCIYIQYLFVYRSNKSAVDGELNATQLDNETRANRENKSK